MLNINNLFKHIFLIINLICISSSYAIQHLDFCSISENDEKCTYRNKHDLRKGSL